MLQLHTNEIVTRRLKSVHQGGKLDEVFKVVPIVAFDQTSFQLFVCHRHKAHVFDMQSRLLRTLILTQKTEGD